VSGVRWSDTGRTGRRESGARSRCNRTPLQAFDFAAFFPTNRYPLRRKMLSADFAEVDTGSAAKICDKTRT